jgi:hypothetical protein
MPSDLVPISYVLTITEIKIIYNLLLHQYVSYENPEVIALVRKLGSIVDKADR